MKQKHLAPYLPYKLYVYDTVAKKRKMMNLGEGSSTNWVGMKTVLKHENIYKPILKSIHSLTKAQLSVLGVHSRIQLAFRLKHDKNLDYTAMLWLFKNHFDVFDRIRKRKAVDYESLTYNN